MRGHATVPPWVETQDRYTRGMAHRSDSTEQRLAETYLLSVLADELGAQWGGTCPVAGIQPDGVDPDKKIVVEVFARVGKLKAAQQRKVKADLFKLAYVRQRMGTEWRALLVFVDEAAAASSLGRAWHVDAARTFGIEIRVMALPDDLRANVLAAQDRQRMVNSVD